MVTITFGENCSNPELRKLQKENELGMKVQFCEKIDNAIIRFHKEGWTIDRLIDYVANEICFWDGGGNIKRKYLQPLKSKPIKEVIDGLNEIKEIYNPKKLLH